MNLEQFCTELKTMGIIAQHGEEKMPLIYIALRTEVPENEQKKMNYQNYQNEIIELSKDNTEEGKKKYDERV